MTEIKFPIGSKVKFTAELTRGSSEIPNDLEEAAKECNSNLQLQEYFIKGGIWQKEQMMKEAVEGKVFMSFAPGCNQRVVSTQDVDLPCETKVKLIIVKED